MLIHDSTQLQQIYFCVKFDPLIGLLKLLGQMIGVSLYSYYNCKMGLYILIFEIFIIVIYGIFIRTGTDSTSTSYYYIEAPLYFTLAFTLLSMKFRMYDWSQLTNFLFVLALSFQMNTLYVIFWKDCFNKSFSSTQTITHPILISNIECALTILVTTFQFTGKLTITQIFALSMVEVFAFALNFSINEFGVKAITGGGTMTIFMFGYLFAIPIRKFCCDQELQAEQQKKQRYFTLIIKMIGLVVCIFLWPNFTYTTAIVDTYYLTDLKSTAYLSEEGFMHMILGFSGAICTTLGLRILGEKILLQRFISTIFLTGIFLSSSATVIIDPFASILMGVFGPVLSYLVEKFLPSILIKGYPIEGIIFAVLGGIFDSIFAAGRSNRTPELVADPSKQGGLQFACLIISAIFAIAFGFLATLILRCFNPRQSVNKDGMFWFVDQQSLPIYPDDAILRRIMGGNPSKTMKQEQVLFDLKNAYITEKARQNVEMGKIIRQNVDEQARIK